MFMNPLGCECDNFESSTVESLSFWLCPQNPQLEFFPSTFLVKSQVEEMVLNGGDEYIVIFVWVFGNMIECWSVQEVVLKKKFDFRITEYLTIEKNP